MSSFHLFVKNSFLGKFGITLITWIADTSWAVFICFSRLPAWVAFVIAVIAWKFNTFMNCSNMFVESRFIIKTFLTLIARLSRMLLSHYIKNGFNWPLFDNIVFKILQLNIFYHHHLFFHSQFPYYLDFLCQFALFQDS